LDLRPVAFSDLSSIQYAFHLGTGTVTHDIILVVSFAGACGIGTGCDDDAHLMEAIGQAAVLAWRPFGLILDLRELTYEWGDMMTEVLTLGEPKRRHGLPTTVLASARCREGLTSLLKEEMGEDPDLWLFDDLPAAVQELERQMQRYWKVKDKTA
jgi:hypothetical protein